MYPRLMAEEALLAVHVADLASGHVRPDDRKRVLSAWEQQSQPGPREAPPAQAVVASLAMAGIQVEVVRGE